MIQFEPYNNLGFNFIGAKRADALEVKMLFVNAKSFQHRSWKIFLFYPEIDYSGADFAFEMAVRGGVRIVPDLIPFDVKS